MADRDKKNKIKAQRILVFQMNGSGESKIAGVKKYGSGLFELDVYDIDQPLPPVIDNAHDYLPREIEAGLVLDYLRHPDLSVDLANLCVGKNIPLIASGKKYKIKGPHTPAT